MNIFKMAYKIKRESSSEIFKGFGFKHLSDATQYYVHPNNQSFKGTTTLCQPIGEGITLFTLLLCSIMNDNSSVTGDVYVSDDKNSVFMEIKLADEWRDMNVTEPEIYGYRVFTDGEKIVLGAYDVADEFLEGNMQHLHPRYKLLPAFAALLALEIQQDSDMYSMVIDYAEHPVADVFVNIHEDFYQIFKADEFEIEYCDLLSFPKEKMTSMRESYLVVKENVHKLHEEQNVQIVRFAPHEFTDEQCRYIPALTSEFVLQKPLNGICSAVAAGDIRAVLLHGPAGTGKTMSCKLICQNIGLPIMDTINCTENLDEFVLGKFIPKDDRIVFCESNVTKAIREGGAVVFEEINFAKPQYLAFLNSLLDDNGFVRLDNGEVVRRNKNFRFLATMNLGYFGTKELNQALYNRFNSVVEVAALSDVAISRMLIARVPECTQVADKMIGVYHKLKKKIEQEELDIVISPRNLENWARLAKYEGYIQAAEQTIIPIAKCERILEESIRGIIALYKWC
ncbi:MAG: AAA family ATPase [Solibacillus sp.]